MHPAAAISDFEKLDVRVALVTDIQPFPQGRHSTHILTLDCGPEIGVKTSLARLAPNYAGFELVGTQVLAIVNLPPRQIGKHRSECLTLGVPDSAGNVVLVRPERPATVGGRLY